MLDSMPRLTAKNYLRTHDRLRKLWLRDEGVFAELSPTDQWLLHDFFVPRREQSDLELLMYRESVTTKRPSLPHQAGRDLSRFWEFTAQLGVKRVRCAKAKVPLRRVKQADRKLTVKPLAQPEVDAKKLARAFIYLGQSIAKKRAEQERQDRSRP